MKHTTPYGAFEIDAMPGQPQLALCHSFFVPEHNRGRGYGHRLKRHQIDLLIEGHFDFAVCTVAGDNNRQHAVLESAGWELLGSFKNSRIGGLTMIYGFDVAAARRKVGVVTQGEAA
jgi:hypothetical protein